MKFKMLMTVSLFAVNFCDSVEALSRDAEERAPFTKTKNSLGVVSKKITHPERSASQNESFDPNWTKTYKLQNGFFIERGPGYFNINGSIRKGEGGYHCRTTNINGMPLKDGKLDLTQSMNQDQFERELCRAGLIKRNSQSELKKYRASPQLNKDKKKKEKISKLSHKKLANSPLNLKQRKASDLNTPLKKKPISSRARSSQIVSKNDSHQNLLHNGEDLKKKNILASPHNSLLNNSSKLSLINNDSKKLSSKDSTEVMNNGKNMLSGGEVSEASRPKRKPENSQKIINNKNTTLSPQVSSQKLPPFVKSEDANGVIYNTIEGVTAIYNPGNISVRFSQVPLIGPFSIRHDMSRSEFEQALRNANLLKQ